jgi:hypothetical protein
MCGGVQDIASRVHSHLHLSVLTGAALPLRPPPLPDLRGLLSLLLLMLPLLLLLLLLLEAATIAGGRLTVLRQCACKLTTGCCRLHHETTTRSPASSRDGGGCCIFFFSCTHQKVLFQQIQVQHDLNCAHNSPPNHVWQCDLPSKARARCKGACMAQAAWTSAQTGEFAIITRHSITHTQRTAAVAAQAWRDVLTSVSCARSICEHRSEPCAFSTHTPSC